MRTGIRILRLLPSPEKRQAFRQVRSGDGMADMRVLEARAVRRAGSTPVPSTSLRQGFGWQAMLRRSSARQSMPSVALAQVGI